MAKLLVTIWCCVFFSFGFIFLNSNASSVTYNVLSFGAKSDGKSDATQPFLKAWVAACSSVKAATIYVPRGKYWIKAVTFRGPCKNKITVQIDGTLVAPSDYRALGNSGYWILFIKVNRISVIGGTLDGNGAGFWNCRKSGKNCPVGARSITFNWANDVVVQGLTSVNSQLMHLVINSCKNVMVKNVRIVAPDLSPNTDGIHIQSSIGVTITGTRIQTGDDCVSIGPGTTNLWMDNIQCGPGHGVSYYYSVLLDYFSLTAPQQFSIGSLARDYKEDGVQNVTLINSVFTGSDNGLRIKSWARASTGFVTNINYQNIMMKNVDNPIIIDQNYCPNHQGCPNQASGIKINQVTYQNIFGTSSTHVAMSFDCSPSNPCSGIKLQDIKLTYLNNKKAQSICKNIRGNARGVILPDNCLL